MISVLIAFAVYQKLFNSSLVFILIRSNNEYLLFQLRTEYTNFCNCCKIIIFFQYVIQTQYYSFLRFDSTIFFLFCFDKVFNFLLIFSCCFFFFHMDISCLLLLKYYFKASSHQNGLCTHFCWLNSNLKHDDVYVKTRNIFYDRFICTNAHQPQIQTQIVHLNDVKAIQHESNAWWT